MWNAGSSLKTSPPLIPVELLYTTVTTYSSSIRALGMFENQEGDISSARTLQALE
jgi:hypothetical protein